MLSAAASIKPPRLDLPSLSVSGNQGYASAKGTWAFEGDSQAQPMQTSDIRCSRESASGGDIWVAEVARGFNEGSPHYLTVTPEYFSVTKWNEDEVLAENDSPRCVTYTLSISLRKKEAHLFRRGKQQEGCEGIATRPQILNLVDGSKVATDFYDKKEAEGFKVANPEFVEAIQKIRPTWKSK